MKMKAFWVFVVALAFWLGHSTATEYARVSIISCPYSDDYEPALQAIEEAKKKVQKGDAGVLAELEQAENHLQKAQSWTRVYLGRKQAGSDSK